MRSTKTREGPITELAVSTRDLEHLIMMATRAPSVHNSQPWRFTATAEGVRIGRDHSRQLDVIDPTGRELLLSCGAALHHLTVAARALGITADVELMSPDQADDTVALVRLRSVFDSVSESGHAASAGATIQQGAISIPAPAERTP